MLTHPLYEKLTALRLTGMLTALKEQMDMADIDQLSFQQRLGLLVDREATDRENRKLKSLEHTDLIVLDDWGLKGFTDEQQHDLLEILEDRHGLRSTLITSQLPVDHWHELMASPTVADAILDRLIHNAYRLNLKGESMRKRKNPLTSHMSSENS